MLPNQLKQKKMAKVLYTALMADMRGKVNGTVASKNRAGAYFRTKVSPVQRQTVAQQGVKSTLTANAQAWRSLTDAQRAAWNGAVDNFKKTDIFGNSRNPSGFNLYVRINNNLTTVGEDAVSLPPLPSAVGSPGALGLSGAAGSPALSMTFVNTPTSATGCLVIQATPQVSAGKSFTKNLFRQIKVGAGADTSPQNILTAYTAKFGTLVAGTRVSVRAYIIDNVTGIAGQPETATCIIAA